MAWHVDDAVQANRLQMSARVGQTLPAHTGPQAQVVVQVFGIHGKHAAEVDAASTVP